MHGYVACVAFRAGIQCRARPIQTPRLSLCRLYMEGRAREDTSIGNYSNRSATGRLHLDLASALKGNGVGAFNLDSGPAAFCLSRSAVCSRLRRPRTGSEWPGVGRSAASLGMSSFRGSLNGRFGG